MTRRHAGRGQALSARLRALSVVCSLALSSSASSAHDANRVHTLIVGRGSALAACDGLNASNDNRARGRFPLNPELAFRVRLPGGSGQAPASDAAGDLIIAHVEPRLSKLDAKGRTLWSERLPSEASCAPVLTSDGSILIVTRDGDALLFSSAGRLEKRRALPVADPRRHTLAIPTASGGALVACGSDLLQLDREAQIVRQTSGKGNISALAESSAGLVAVGENGSVELGRASGDFTLAGSFGGAVPEGAAVQAGKVLAVVDAHRWLSLDLSTGQVVTLASDAALAFSGPAAVLETGGAALVADSGFVSLRARDGAETQRVLISAARQAVDPALRNLRPARLIGDSAGAVAVVQSGNDALVLGPDGNAVRLDGTSCLDPFRPTPTPSGLVFSCRSGQLFGVSGKAP